MNKNWWLVAVNVVNLACVLLSLVMAIAGIRVSAFGLAIAYVDALVLGLALYEKEK